MDGNPSPGGTFTSPYANAPMNNNKLLGERPVCATFLLPVNHAAAGVIEFDIATAGIGMELKRRVSQGDGGHRIKAPAHRDSRDMAVDLKRPQLNRLRRNFGDGTRKTYLRG